MILPADSSKIEPIAWHPNGEPWLMLGFHGDGIPFVAVADSSGKRRMIINGDSAGAPAAILLGNNDQFLLKATFDDNGLPGVILFNDEEMPSHALTLETWQALKPDDSRESK